MRIELGSCTVRSWEASDVPSLARYADNRKVWINLRDAFPHPYTRHDAEAFLAMVRRMAAETYFAIDVGGEAAGAIGYRVHEDVERVSAELGYWLGEPFWNRGIATDAVRAVTSLAVERHRLTRVYAVPYEWNPASCRVLEKAGYALEGRMRKSAVKDGKVVDQFLYAYVVGP
jgi:ribosomal-protein-alanine N-acetyltransferase